MGDLTLTDMYSVPGTGPHVIEHVLYTLKRSYSRLDIDPIILNKVIVAQRVRSLLKDTQPAGSSAEPARLMAKPAGLHSAT